ncbi:MAG TPA: hypothetical protein VF516_40230 [Kofleriaceae bacterium]
MKTLDHWKNYEPIADVATHDAQGAGPIARTLQVTAHVAGSDLAAPLGLTIAGLCHLALTRTQLSALRRVLARAELDLRTVAQQPVVAARTEGRCEICSRLIVTGDLVYVIDDGGGEHVLAHAERCPGPSA